MSMGTMRGPGASSLVAGRTCREVTAQSLQVSPDGRWIAATFDCEYKVWVWSLTDDTHYEIDIERRHRVEDLAFSKDNTSIFVSAGPGAPLKIDVASGTLTTWEMSDTQPTQLTLDLEGQQLLRVLDLGRLEIRTLDGHLKATLSTPTPTALIDPTLSADGIWAYARDEQHRLHQWHVASGVHRHVRHVERPIVTWFVAQDGQTVMTLDAQGVVLIHKITLPQDPEALRAALLAELKN